MKRVLSILLMLATCALWMPAGAEETRIVGEVFAAETGEPISNVSVYFKGTKVGTTTDENGNFYLHVDLMRTATLMVSSIGYKTQKFTIEPGKDAGLAVVLEEKRNKLDELIVLPGANPALPLMDSVRAHRQDNKPADDSRTGETEQQFFLSHITSKTLKRRLWKSLESGMIMQEDSTYILPLPESMGVSLAVPVPEHLNFYDATIPFGSLSFLSPTAVSANAYYQYFLIDSLSEPKRYLVDFRPKNSFDPLFAGTLTIDSATYAITDVKASIPREANVNYLSSLHHAAQYDVSAPRRSVLQDEQLSAVMDIAIKADSSHTFPALLVKQHYKGQSSSLENAENSVLSDSAANAGDLGESEQSKHTRTRFTPQQFRSDSTDLPLFRFASWLGWLVHTGYIRTGTPVDIGNVQEIIQINHAEKLHLGLPFRTNEKLFPHVSLEGYIGYGFRDRAIKYKAQVQAILPTQRRNILGLYVWDRYVYSENSSFDDLARENSWIYANMTFTGYVLRDVFYKNSNAFSTSVRKREVRLWTENDWLSGHGSVPSVESKLAVQIGRMGYGNPMDYHYYDMPSFRFQSLSAVVRLGWHERVADLYLTRKHIYSTYPTLFVGGEIGTLKWDEETHYRPYGNINVLLRQDASLGMGGTLSYTFQAGMVFGRDIPYPFLAILDGNQSYTFVPTRFTLMNNNQFTNTKYLALHVDWNGQGILFNRIPGVRYLRLRELAEMKVAYGDCMTVPYVEMGVGIGNILRIGEVYSVWRLTNPVNKLNRDMLSPTPMWAIRFRLSLGL